MASPGRYCSRCGSPIDEGAAFCAKCGAPVSATTAAQPSTPTEPYRYRRYEKQEKQEKHEKNEKNEKGTGGGDLTGPITGGLILIWLGVTFYLQQANYIPSSNWWAYFLMGLGVILILQGVMRYSMSRRPFVGSFIGGAVLFIIGLAFVQGLGVDLWPLILVAIGAAVILSAFSGRRRRPPP